MFRYLYTWTVRQCAVVIIIIWFQGPQQYVDELLEIHRKFSTLIKDTFRDDPAFISALDKVTHYYIIYEIRTLTLKYEDLTNWFDNVIHCNVIFFPRFIQRNTSVYRLNYHVELSKYLLFHKNLCQTHLNCLAEKCMPARGLCPGIHFCEKNGKLRAYCSPI